MSLKIAFWTPTSQRAAQSKDIDKAGMLVQNLELQGSWVPDQFESLFEPTQNNLAPAPFRENNRGSGYYWLQLALLQSWIHTAAWQMLAKLPVRRWISFRSRKHSYRSLYSSTVWPAQERQVDDYLPVLLYILIIFLTLLSPHQNLILLFKIYCETLFSYNHNLSMLLRGDNKLGFSKPQLQLGKWSLVRSQVVTFLGPVKSRSLNTQLKSSLVSAKYVWPQQSCAQPLFHTLFNSSNLTILT